MRIADWAGLLGWLSTGCALAAGQAGAAAGGAASGLTEVRSIRLADAPQATVFSQVAMTPDGELLTLTKSASGLWRLDEVRGWDGAHPNQRSLRLGAKDAISGKKAQAFLGLDPSGRYAIVTSSNDPPFDPGRRTNEPVKTLPGMLTVIDLSSAPLRGGLVVGRMRTVPPKTLGSYGFYGETLLTIAKVPGLPLNEPVNELSAWRMPGMHLEARCRHTGWVEDAEHHEPNPHGCDELLKAVGATSEEEVVRVMSVGEKPKDSRVGWGRSSPDGKLRLDWGAVPRPDAKMRTLTVSRTEDGETVGEVTVDSPFRNWAVLAEGDDGDNYLLVVERSDRVTVYRCGR